MNVFVVVAVTRIPYEGDYKEVVAVFSTEALAEEFELNVVPKPGRYVPTYEIEELTVDYRTPDYVCKKD